MKAQTIINKGKFVAVSTAKSAVKSVATCAITTTSAAAPVVIGMSLGDKITRGKWNVKKNATEFLKGAAVVSAVYVGCRTANTLLCSTMTAIKSPNPTAEDLEDEFDDFDRYVAD